MPLGYMLHKTGICESKIAAWSEECTKIDWLFMYQYNRYVKLIHIHSFTLVCTHVNAVGTGESAARLGEKIARMEASVLLGTVTRLLSVQRKSKRKYSLSIVSINSILFQ